VSDVEAGLSGGEVFYFPEAHIPQHDDHSRIIVVACQIDCPVIGSTELSSIELFVPSRIRMNESDEFIGTSPTRTRFP